MRTDMIGESACARHGTPSGGTHAQLTAARTHTTRDLQAVLAVLYRDPPPHHLNATRLYSYTYKVVPSWPPLAGLGE